jgi:hypothetical protein
MEEVIVASRGIASNMGKNRMLVRVNSATLVSLGAKTLHLISPFTPGTFSELRD